MQKKTQQLNTLHIIQPIKNTIQQTHCKHTLYKQSQYKRHNPKILHIKKSLYFFKEILQTHVFLYKKHITQEKTTQKTHYTDHEI